MGGVNLHAVKACLLRAAGGLCKLPDDPGDFLGGHVIGFDLYGMSPDLSVKGTEGKLTDDGNAFGVDEVRQFLVLGMSASSHRRIIPPK